MAAYATGSVAVGPIDHLCHIPESMKKAVKVNIIHKKQIIIFYLKIYLYVF